MKKVTWRKKGVDEPQTGAWHYNRGSGTFTIQLDSRDPVTGLSRTFTVYDDTPDFNGYVRDAK